MDPYNSNESDGLFDHLKSEESDIESLLEQSQKEQKERLESELTRIKQQLDRRDHIHETIMDDLEWKVDWYTDRLESLYKTGRGRKDGERERLQNRIEAFYAYLREEDREHWRDRQELERERREIARELEELNDSDLFDEI